MIVAVIPTSTSDGYAETAAIAKYWKKLSL